MQINGIVTTNNPEYGNGHIVFISEDERLISVKFENKELAIMCNQKETVHLDKGLNTKIKIA